MTDNNVTATYWQSQVAVVGRNDLQDGGQLGQDVGEHGQAAEHEADVEKSPERRLAVDVAVADRRRCDYQEVDALEVRQTLPIELVSPRVPIVLKL